MSISRQALAAALLEYDNENLPQYEQKDHRRSAIFSLLKPKLPKEYTLPPPNIDDQAARAADSNERSDGTGHGGALGQSSRPRAGSRGTFMSNGRIEGGPGGHGRDDGAEELIQAPMIQVEEDVDLDRWDLPEHLVTEDARPSSRQSRVQPSPFTAPQPSSPGSSRQQAQRQSIAIPGTRNLPHARSVPSPMTSPLQARAVSVHLEPGDGMDIVEHLASRSISRTGDEPRRRTISFETHGNNDTRRRTFSDLNNADAALARAERLRTMASTPGLAPRASSIVGFPMHDQNRFEDVRIHEPVMVPLPDSPLSLAASGYRPMSAMSRGSRGASFELGRRARSGTGQGGYEEYDDHDDDEENDTEPNPFALPAPSIHNASRFDPKAAAILSTDDLLSIAPTADLRRPMSTANLARLNRMNDGTATPVEDPADMVDPDDPLGIMRGRETYEDLPPPEVFGRGLIPNKYARRAPVNRHELLRPKTLVMPATLTGQAPVVKKQNVPEGFILGDKPLPASARSSILTPGPLGGIGAAGVMSQSMSTGRLGPLDGRVYGAAIAMEQQEADRLQWEAEEREKWEAAEARRQRMPGKLYGTSLMDQLEARKLQMRGKQRQFGGDSRPAMMARQSMLSIPHSPSSPLSATDSPDHAARAPLLSFDSNGNLSAAGASPDKSAFDITAQGQNRMSYPHPGMTHSQSAQTHLGAGLTPGPGGMDDRPRLAKSKSVFGVDTIWEREMAKLKIMQEAEAKEVAEREERERLKGHKKGNRKSFWAGGAKGKDKEKGKASPAGAGVSELSPAGSPAGVGAHMVRVVSGGQEPDGQEVMLSPPRSNESRAISVPGGSPVKRAPDMPPMLEFSPEKKKVAPPPVDAVEDIPPTDAATDGDKVDPLAPKHLGTFASGQPVPPSPPSPVIEPEHEAITSPRIQIEDDDSSDEEVPLSRLKAPTTTSTYGITGPLPKVQLNSDLSGSLGLSVPVLPTSVSPRPPSFMGDALADFGIGGTSGGDDEEDDDVPLGVRQSRLIPPAAFSLAHKTSQPLTERPEEEKEEIEDDLPLGFKHAAAVSRRVASGGVAPAQPQVQQQQQQQQSMQGSASMYGWQGPMGGGMNMPMGMGMSGMGSPMGYPQAGSMYGMGMPAPSMHMGMGMPSMYGNMANMGMPQMGYGGAGMDMSGMGGMMQPPGPMPPTEMPGANIDSWRKGVRAPSTIGGESRVSGMN